ncbi:MAG: serine/threonine-protein kinase [Gemmatimonadota bacterium]
MTAASRMTPERWATVEALFWQALELPEGRRASLLERTRETDPGLATEVETLLDEHRNDSGFLENPVVGRLPDPGFLSEGESIGPYRLIRPLGRGGMGEVHLAVRETDGVRQHVALKIIRRDLDSREVLERFRRERRILASLVHPSIARLIHVDSADDGRPYLVMEYVEGVPITAWIREREAGPAERIRLFQRVCTAVSHAHQRLVVHGDIKPANVLVTPDGAPKLVDFGIAALLHGEAEGEGGGTASGSEELRPLTPEYASPEQRRGEALGLASDVYSLGVLLHVVLTGRQPGAGASLPRDLEAIVGKALAPDPDHRYGTAAALADDLQRHLDGLPVQARPATPGYVVSRFARRNRFGVGAGAAFIILLTAFSVVTAFQSRRIQEESDRVARERDQALEVRAFLLEAFGTTGPDEATGDSVTARQLLDRRAAMLEEEYGGRPALRATMLDVLAQSYERLGLYAEAEPLAREALELREAALGPDDPDLPAAYNTLGWILHQVGNHAEAAPVLVQAVETGRRLHPEGHPILARALNDLGVNLEARGDYTAAEAAYLESLEMRRRLLDAGDVGTAVTASNLSVVRYRRADYPGAVATAREAHEAFSEALGPDHRRTMIVEGNLAAMQAAMGDWSGARLTYRDILERQRRLLGPRHPTVARTMTSLAGTIPAGEGDTEAETLLREALDIQAASLGPDHPTVAATSRLLAVTLSRTGRTDEARPHFERALQIQRSVLGPRHQEVGETLALLAASLRAGGNLEQGVSVYREAVAVRAEALGPDHVATARTEVALANVLLATGQVDEAAERLQRSWRVLEPALPPEHLFAQEARTEWARLHVLRGETARADSVLQEAERLLTPDQGEQLVGRMLRELRQEVDARASR